jgi:hypothetical protein
LRPRGGCKQGQREKGKNRSSPRDESAVQHLSIIGQSQANS